MAKVLKFFLAKLFLLITVINLVACSPDQLAEIWIVTDSAPVIDGGFNSEIHKSAQEWVNKFNDNRVEIAKLPGMEYWKDHEMRLRAIIPTDAAASTLEDSYNIAAFLGAKVIIGSGFSHVVSMSNSVQNRMKKNGTKLVLIDAFSPTPVNLAAITYDVSQSAFFAGIAAWVYLVANADGIYQGKILDVATFGGMPIEPVINYMWGFYASIVYANEYKLNENNGELLTMVNALRQKNGKKDLEEKVLKNINVKFKKLTNSFSNSFESGKGTVKAIVDELINIDLVKIIMPVAAAQIVDVIRAITDSDKNNSAKIIGVDVDQSKKYPNSPFLTSAKKGIKKSVQTILMKAFNLDYDKNNNIFFSKNGVDYFDGSRIHKPWGGKKFSGISDSQALTGIYKMLIENDKLWKIAEKCSYVFSDISNYAINNGNDWNRAWLTFTDDKNYGRIVEKLNPNFF